MRIAWHAAFGVALSALCGVGPVASTTWADTTEPTETLLLQDPTVSDRDVVFVHAGDLWVVSREGGEARRLTSSAGTEGAPRLSPDGKWVAFSGQYEGNLDVYLMSIEGGIPRRLTWHPGPDRVQGWHPDGKRILFTSPRAGGAPVDRLYLVDLEGHTPEALPIPKAFHAAIGAGDGRVAYTPYGDAFRTWKRYRGGRTTPIWIFDPRTNEVEQIPHENASDSFPCWLGGAVYFASDRDGHMNLWRYAPGSGAAPERLTSYTDFDVRHVTTGGGVVAFEQAGAIHLYDPAAKAERRLRVTMRTDGLGGVPRWVPAKGSVRNAGIAPLGQRAVFEARGEIVTVPREFGDPRNLSNSPGANDRDPTWSPDGKKIAWFSDESGEYRLVVRDHLGREAAKSYALGGAGFYHDPSWSPDGKKILFTDKANRVAYLTLENGEVTEITRCQGSLGSIQPTAVWSADGKWIAYEGRCPGTAYDRIRLYELAGARTIEVTDAFGSADSPAFSKDGKHLFFRASIDSGPRRFGLDMSASAARDPSNSIYCVVLQKDGKNPLAPKSDEGDSGAKKPPRPEGPAMDGEEKPPASDKPSDKPADKPSDKPSDKPEEPGSGMGDGKGEGDAKEGAGGEKAPKLPAIDADGLDQRILALPIPAGRVYRLQCGKDKLLWLERAEDSPAGTLQSFDFEERKPKEVLKGVQDYLVASGGKDMLVRTAAGFSIVPLAGKDEKRLDVDSVKVRVEPQAEWKQILREVWRIQRDYFYDPHLHGVDWPAMWERHSAFLSHVHHRGDLNVLIGEMMGELACGHEYVSGGDVPAAPTGASVGLLGADLEAQDGRYKVTRIYRGQNWNPGLRSPLSGPGTDVKVGDFLLAVNGVPLTADREIYSAFENTADTQVELTLSDAPQGGKTRTTTVVPVSDDSELRRRAWIEGNRKRVDELSGGRLAYAYMPDTGGAGLAAFERDFYSQIDREGLVLDERYNGGGKIADHVVEILSREPICYWVNREGWVAKSPFASLTGPKVMIVNERAGSGGDAMPWMFQRLKLGPVVGTRTWGGLVGISGYPPLMDGGSVTAASFGIMAPDGKWVVENEGVTPDAEVVEWPKDVIAGHDPQLEKAVELALKALKDHPPKPPPSYVPPKPR
jgi:tricorn protease